MKQPIHIIKGQECNCEHHKPIKGKFRFVVCSCDIHCKGKSPDIKIVPFNKDLANKKKGEVVEFITIVAGSAARFNRLSGDRESTEVDEAKQTTNFHLTKDAEVKTAQEIEFYSIHELTEEQDEQWGKYVVNNNLKESDKLVWLEGYDE